MTIQKYTKENLTACVLQCFSWAGVLRHLGLKQHGGSQAYIKKKAIDLGVDFSHFKGQAWNKGNTDLHTKDLSPQLIKGDKGISGKRIKNFLIRTGIWANECAICLCQGFWNNLPLRLQVDHINGDHLDNRLENLRLVCPNCHSQTETYCGKNVSNRVININKCIKCLKPISKKSTTCLRCRPQSAALKPRKFDPSRAEIIKTLEATTSIIAAAKVFNVSDNGLRKRCNLLGIDWRKYSCYKRVKNGSPPQT